MISFCQSKKHDRFLSNVSWGGSKKQVGLYGERLSDRTEFWENRKQQQAELKLVAKAEPEFETIKETTRARARASKLKQDYNYAWEERTKNETSEV